MKRAVCTADIRGRNEYINICGIESSEEHGLADTGSAISGAVELMMGDRVDRVYTMHGSALQVETITLHVLKREIHASRHPII